MPLPNQLAKQKFEGIDPILQQWLDQLADTVNTHSGYNGPIQISDHLDMGGNRIMNLATASALTDALSSGDANTKFSAPVIAKQIESGGSTPLKTYRAINNQSQREQVSSFLNDLMSTPPSANSIYPTLTNGSGNVTVSIPASRFMFADGSFVNTIGRTDILSTPAQFAISSISCTGNVVSVVAAATGLIAGNVATITGVTPSSFNGTFVITSSTGGGTNLTYQLDLGTASGSGGFVQVNGVWYYAIQKRLNALKLLGPFSGDTAQNRLEANNDGFQIVAVVVITNSGGQISLSGGGGSPIVGAPTAGAFF